MIRVVQRALDCWKHITLRLLVVDMCLLDDLPRPRFHTYLAIGMRGCLGKGALLSAVFLVLSIMEFHGLSASSLFE